MRQENEHEDQGEGVQNSGKTSTDVRGRDMGIEEGTEDKLEVTEMRMLRWMFGVTKLDKIRNERIREQRKWKFRKGGLMWYGQVMRRYDH